MKSLVKQPTSTTEAKSAGEALTRKHAGINVLYDQEEDKTTVKNYFASQRDGMKRARNKERSMPKADLCE